MQVVRPILRAPRPDACFSGSVRQVLRVNGGLGDADILPGFDAVRRLLCAC
jgi:hypothetical protein